MFFLFFQFALQNRHGQILYALYVRPAKNPLESYPFTYLPLCISEPVPGFSPIETYKCKRSVVDVPLNRFLPPQTWCTTELNQDSRLFLGFLLNKRYQLLFTDDNRQVSSNLGPTNYSVFTHFNFVFLKTLNEFTLNKVVSSNPINITEQFLGFTYETSFISTSAPPADMTIIKSFLIGSLCAIIIILIALLNPSQRKHSYITVARYPNHSFPLVIACGSGVGLITFFTVLIVIMAIHPHSVIKIRYIIISEMASAFVTSVITSMLCGVWKLHDVASALYFAPLFFPTIFVVLIFTVEWISVSVDSCSVIPLNYIFYFIVSVVFVMIPTNLIGSLITAALFKPKRHLSRKVKLSIHRFSRSRRHYLTVANSLIAFIIFPVLQIIIQKLQYGTMNYHYDSPTMIMFPFVILLASVASGIASIAIKCESDGDWALFSFFSAAGSTIAVWFVSIIRSAIFEGQKSTLQFTLFPTLAGLLCLILALMIGSMSVLTSQLWISYKGIGVRKVSI